jgi:hypothetical protein
MHSGRNRTCPILPPSFLPLHLVHSTSSLYGGLGPTPCIYMPGREKICIPAREVPFTPPSNSSFSLFHPSISVSFSYRRTLVSGRRPMHMHAALRRYAFRQERYPLRPPHLFLLSFIRPSPSHSLIGAPSFLDGDPCICMSPRGTYAFREEKYPYPCTHMPPVERYASPNKTCPILPPHFLGPLHLGPLHLSFL